MAFGEQWAVERHTDRGRLTRSTSFIAWLIWSARRMPRRGLRGIVQMSRIPTPWFVQAGSARMDYPMDYPTSE